MRKIHYKGRLFLLHWIQNNARGLVDDDWFIIEFIDGSMFGNKSLLLSDSFLDQITCP